MPSTAELCEQFYGTRDIYEIFSVGRDAPETEIRKAYYKISLIVHPDRVEESEKVEATEKFKVVSKIYAILADETKRALFDDHGIIDDDDDSTGFNWLLMWQQFFRPISAQDIDNYEKKYVGSETERNDIKKSYLNGKGCINYLMDRVQFMNCQDEPRVIGIIQEMIANGEVPEYKICTKEPKEKRDRRHKKYAREAQEAQEMMAADRKRKSQASLEQQLALKQAQRERSFAALLEKYSNKEDDFDNVISIDDYAHQKKPNKPKSKKTQPKPETEPRRRNISKGRVTKKSQGSE